MRRFLLAGLAVGALLSSTTPAMARQGCGLGFHRGPYGGCRPNRGPGYGPGRPAIGVFYPGRGYWYRDRYWAHRYRWRNGWRYR